MLRCDQLIGMRYRLGADGSEGEIDCINLVYRALEDLGIPAPVFKPSWYEAGYREIYRDLLRWGAPVEKPRLNGDVALLQGERAFSVAWSGGILCVSQASNTVQWCLPSRVSVFRCFRMRKNFAA